MFCSPCSTIALKHPAGSQVSGEASHVRCYRSRGHCSAKPEVFIVKVILKPDQEQT